METDSARCHAEQFLWETNILNKTTIPFALVRYEIGYS